MAILWHSEPMRKLRLVPRQDARQILRGEPYRVRIDVSGFVIGVLAWIGFITLAIALVFGVVRLVIG